MTTFLICGNAVSVFAERLSVRNYTTADGLANDEVNRIYPDSRGFLWFCTEDGLSRFDGYRFKNYTQEDGLPHRNINDILELENGKYLVATTNGLTVFDPQGKAFRWNILTGNLEQTSNETPLFKTYFPEAGEFGNSYKIISGLGRDENGQIFAGTGGYFLKVEVSDGDVKFQRIVNEAWKNVYTEFGGIFKDSNGDLWISSSKGVFRLLKDGTFETVSDKSGGSVFEDREGRIWVNSSGEDIGIRVYKIKPKVELINTFTKKDGLAENRFTNAVAQTENGRIFVVSNAKLFEFLPNSEPKFRQFENSIGFASTTDKSGNIWFNIPGKGVARYSPKSFTTYNKLDGLPEESIDSIFGNKQGEVFFTIGKDKLGRIFEDKFEIATLKDFKGRSWIPGFLDLHSKTGEWWAPSNEGLFVYPSVKTIKDLEKNSPKKVFPDAKSAFPQIIYALFEDSHDNIWIGAADENSSLFRFERSTGKIYRYTKDDGLPISSSAVSFGEDNAGNVWIGFYHGRLFRYKDGKFRGFNSEDGFVDSYPSGILTDKKGSLWIATRSKGVFRTDNPNDENPVFSSISTAQGLSTNQALCLTEDDYGRIYVGTGNGINRIEPETLRFKIYTQADGLPANYIMQCYKNPDGNLWFSSYNTLIKFTPQEDNKITQSPIFIDGITVNGNERKVSELGETEINDVELNSDEKRIQISYFAVSLSAGESLRYQYKIEGQEWSAPNDQRRVNLNLSAGNYKFFVRAINSDGVVSENPAVFTFKIQYPVWQRWWFVALALLMIGGLIFALDRYRVSKTRQVEAALDETRRAGKIIRESEIRYRTLAETASDAIITIDTNSNIVYVNEACEQIFGFTAKELMGKPLVSLMPERHRSNHDAGIKRYLESKTKTFEWNAVELQGLHKLGHEIPLELSFGEFEKDGERFFTGIARDISERKKAEAALQKAREERFKELERVRTRIATDLHDDIGSSLTQIAVLSEVARGQANLVKAENLSPPLERIKAVSRELVTVMSDIVWAINPQKDFLNDLVQRMRRFASDVYSGRGIKFEFRAPEIEGKLQLGANIRREVFAIFKEVVNNSVKYSECANAFVEFEVNEVWLKLRVEDDGKGFDVSVVLSEDFKPEMGGNGLINIKRRAKELGGSCEITSDIGRGTKITLKIPLHTNGKDFDNLPE
ncbi:MAG TPA: PAS domain S-box protein [Pyrinomonadaceae bacterium]|nr:PAS domain S-box protein [Pyrinomonadaceae bacterium]